MSEPLYCTGCGREWGCGSCACPEDDHHAPEFMTGQFCHVCGVKDCGCEFSNAPSSESEEAGE